MSKFLIVLLLLLIGFTFGLYYIQGGYDDDGDNKDVADNIFDLYIAFKYLFQLTVGAGDLALEDIVDETTAEIYTIVYIVFGTILMMNLLIALMTTEYEEIYKKATTEIALARAETTYDLSHRTRYIPYLCIYVNYIFINAQKQYNIHNKDLCQHRYVELY